MKKGRAARVLYLDIENSRMIISKFPTYVLWNIDRIDHKYIEHDWYITCASWAWLDLEKQKIGKIESVSTADFTTYKKDFRNDKGVVKALLKVISEADLVIGHNSDSFDLKKINDRATVYGLESIDIPPTVDTLKANKKYRKSSSNSLAYLARQLGVPTKIDLPKGVMHDADEGCEKSLKKLVAYNKGDIISGASVYFKLMPYIKNHPDIRRIMGLINTPIEGQRTMQCGTCNSNNVKKDGIYKSKTGVFTRVRCKDCGSVTKGPKV